MPTENQNVGGRPLLFKTPEEFDKRANEYFNLCKEQEKTPFITGLADFLDTSRKTLTNYKKEEGGRKGFFHSIKKALDKCEAAIEEGAMTNKLNPTFSIFNLKNNYGWVDESKKILSGGIRIEDLAE